MTASFRKNVLFKRPGLTASLSYYAPGLKMRQHRHDYHQVSWLLVGEMQESGRRREQDLFRFSCGFKPAEFVHANRYGPSGSLILAVNIDPEAGIYEGPLSLKDWRWRLPEDDRAQRRLGQLLVLLADPDSAEEQVIWDLLALSHHGGQPESSRPPAWLTEVRDALRDGQDDLSLGTLAREAGVHRVHLSRSFTRWFGTSPSLYRSRSALARALTAMATGQSLSRAANDAGFADQAHLHRIAKRQTGLTPGALCRLSRSGQVTSVQ